MKEKGFTIVELLVVVAIITVLAGIVFVNVSGYKEKTYNTKIQGNFTEIQTYGTIYLAEEGDYDNFCESPKMIDFRSDFTAMGLIQNCHDNANAWCFCSWTYGSPLATTCVDSTGYRKKTSSVNCNVRCHPSTSYACLD